MREIKFRVAEFDDNEKFCDFTYFDTKEKFDSKWLDYTDKTKEIQFYTGLKDKNGKEIYEGDIIKTPSPAGYIKYKVIWEREKLRFYAFPLIEGFDRNLIETCGDWGNEYMTPIEVIGNIYENPNLLTIK